MGVGESLKEIYYSWEEKWYDLLDKIDTHLPIYKIIDPIDQVFPSFALFLILFFILILLLTLGIFGFAGTQQASLTLTIVAESGEKVNAAEITINEGTEKFYSNQFGLVKPITVQLGKEVKVRAKKDNTTVIATIYVGKTQEKAEIVLKGYGIELMEAKTITLTNEQGLKITNEKLTLNFECSTGAEPVERTKDVYNGTANIDVKTSCGNLIVTVVSEKYERKSVTLINPSTTIPLALLVPTETGKAIIKLKNSDGNTINESITVQAFRATNLYSAAETKVSINGEAIFDLPEGEYKFKTVAGSGYKVGESTIFNINKTTPTTIEVKLDRSSVGILRVTAKVGNTLLSGVNIVLMKGTSQIEAKTTNTTGMVEFEAPEVGPFNIYATKDGYCESIITSNAPADVNITLKSNTGTCGGKLRAKVVDADGKPVVFAKVIIFGEKEDDEYKTTYIEKLTDYNGVVSWDPVNYTKEGEKYKVFAFKGTYSGWSIAREFKTTTETEEFRVKLEIPFGKVNIIVKDNYGTPITSEDGEPVYVQLFGDYDNSKLTGQRIIEGTEGKITIETKAGRKVYAVIRKEGYETYTTIPKLMIGNGQITFNVTLSKPPIEKIQIRALGLFKNDSKAMTVQPGQEYLALFELIAPIEYSELGFFIRVGSETNTKTELDNMYIKEMVAPGINHILTGATYNKPKGYNIDNQYLNLEQSKWGQVTWTEYNYAPGKIIVGAVIKIKENANQVSDVIAYRAWGVLDGAYDRDLSDEILGTSQSNSQRQELYAATIDQFISIGTESLCEESGDNTFCISSSYTDTEGFTNNFDTSFDAKNNSLYKLNLKVMSRAGITFDKAATKVENPQENLYLGTYSIIKPREGIINGTINGYESNWIDTPNYSPGTSITINPLEVTPRAIGSADLKLRIRNDSRMVLEKIFNIYVMSDKKMRVEYMYLSEFQKEVPKLVSGKMQPVTVKVFNTANNIEIENALVKLYDRFGTKLTEGITNKVGVATIEIPAALPAEKLTIKIEKPEYETYVKEIIISEDVITVTPTELAYTLNPQTTQNESKTIKVENKTGLDLEIKSIKLTGKFKGKIAESRTESALNAYVGEIIKADDFEELDLKIFIASDVTIADDLEGTFEITVGNGYNEWVKKVNSKIRIGLGKDVDNPSCLEISQTSWNATTQGEEVQVAFNLTNNCTVGSKLVLLKNLGARNDSTASVGTMSVQSVNAYTELSRSYNKVFRTTLEAGETIPITLKFSPFAGINGTATGNIIFEAKNPTDSKDQVLTTSLEYKIEAINLNDCVVVAADLVEVEEDSTGSFTITNNCTTKVDFTIDNSKITISDKIFSIPSKGTKDITITRNAGEIPGMYNLLVKGREGSKKQEILGNVKVFFPAADSCIELTRYEYDIYDSQYEDYDGSDTGYLKNNCTEKVITVRVEGTEPYDKSRVWQQALIGAVIGFFKSDCDSWIGKLTGFKCNNEDNNKWVDESLSASKALQKSIDKLKAATSAHASEIDANVKATNAEAQETINEAKEHLEQTKTKTQAIIEEKYQKTLAKCNTCTNEAEKSKCKEDAKANRNAADSKLDSIISSRINKLDQSSTNLKSATDKTTGLLKQALPQTKESADNTRSKLETQIQVGATTTSKLEPELLKEELKAEKELAQALIDSDDARRTAYTEFNELAKTGIFSVDETDKQITAEMKELMNKDPSTNCSKGVDTPQTKTCQELINTMPTSTTVTRTFELRITCQNGETELTNYTPETDKKKCCVKETPVSTETKKEETPNLTTLATVENAGRAGSEDGRINVLMSEKSTGMTTSTNLCFDVEGNYYNQTETKCPYNYTKIDISNAEFEGICCKLTNAAEENNSSNQYVNNTVAKDKKTIEIETFKNTLTRLGCNNLEESWASDVTCTNIAEKSITYRLLNQGEKYYWQDAETRDCFNNQLNMINCENLTLIGAQFLLASSTGASSSSGFGNMFGGLSNLFTENMTGIAGGMFSNSALGGALISALMEMASASDTQIEYTDSFVVPKVVIDSVTLESPEGVSVSVGEVTYDFDSGSNYNSTVGESYSDSERSSSSSSSQSSNTSGANNPNQNNYGSGLVYNTSNLSARESTIEVRELTFTNSGNKNNDSPYEPFSAILKVAASESVYQTDYNYEAIKKAAIERGEYKEAESIFEGWWIIEDIFKGNQNEEDFDYAEITEEDLVVESVRDYSKQFHLLFDSYEYVDCGPETYPCPAATFGSCTIGSKTGSTGAESAPKLKFNWNWTGSAGNSINVDTCDEFKCVGANCEVSNPDYVYCDVTQFTIATLKKIQEMKTFFKTTSLPSCPQAITIAGTKTQPIESNALDVAVTQTQFKPTTSGAILEAIVKSNNQLEMDVKLTFKLTRTDGEEVSVPQCVLTKKVVSEQIYSCEVKTSELGSGTGEDLMCLR
jgi:hypothetical protein